eukprot:1898819-Amphidinium_carterae.1
MEWRKWTVGKQQLDHSALTCTARTLASEVAFMILGITVARRREGLARFYARSTTHLGLATEEEAGTGGGHTESVVLLVDAHILRDRDIARFVLVDL